MRADDRLIASASSWEEFFAATCSLPTTAQQGTAFERLTQLYLQTQPEYQSSLETVWSLTEVPAEVRKQLRLTRVDEGIDLIAKTRDGDFWAIQCKFRSDKDHRLTRRELSTFTSLTFHTCQGIALAVVAHTCAKPVKKHDLLPNTVEIGLERWLALAGDDWQRIRQLTAGKAVRPKPRKPRPHQKQAVAAAKKHYVEGGASRGRLIMPCGTGKSLTAFWIARALAAKTILVAVPSLALVRQSLTDWTREYLALGQTPDWLVVCSDESTGKLDRDEFVGSTYDLGIPTTTDSDEIAAFLKGKSSRPRVLFTTYQSGAKLSAGARLAKATFDLGILDEAHKTVGAKSKAFAALLFDKNVPIRRRVFMTATERVLCGRNDDVLSMSDSDAYGERFYSLSFKHAIAERLISDYRILTVTVSDERIRELVEDRRLVDLGDGDLDAIDATTVAAGVALKRTVAEHGVRHAVSFHRSIRRASDFTRQQDVLNSVESLGAPIENLHISSKQSAGERADLLRSFTKSPLASITNARCLTEGVDVPAIDCVLFADPKQSTVDIVQAAGRALRRFEGKKCGYILLPLVVPSEMSFEEFAETTEFRQVAKVITALSTQDERIAEEFRTADRAKRPGGSLVLIEGDAAVGVAIHPDEFANKVFARLWERVGRANWRPFPDAREYARSLKLGKFAEWRQFCIEHPQPADIPSNPQSVYASEGWKGWGDWLGTGNVASRLMVFRPFEDAREFVREIGLKRTDEWRQFAASERCPSDIPSNPNSVYKGSGWKGMGDWLGTGNVANFRKKFRAFREAREFARGCGMKKSGEWKKFATGQKRPADIPSDPQTAYAGKGWKGWGDWLGTGNIHWRDRSWRPYSAAQAFARATGAKSVKEWRQVSKRTDFPSDIPVNADQVYKDKGWQSWGEWLGTGEVGPGLRVYRPFSRARAFVRGLGLRSTREWQEYVRSGQLPQDVSASPRYAYKADWISMGDWLGTGNIAYFRRKCRPFLEARRAVRRLGIRSMAEWRAFSKSGRLPADIPAAPWRTYLGKGWKDMGDWLGTGTIAPQKKVYLGFQEARDFARGLDLSSQTEWHNYAKSGKRPADIPSNPQRSYRGAGWINWRDWLHLGE